MAAFKFAPVRHPDRRRAPRYACELELALAIGEGEVCCKTIDVSLYGVFVRTDERRAVDEMLKVIVRRGLDDPIEWMGIVRRAVGRSETSSGYPRGLALELFSIDDASWSRWAFLIAQVADRCELAEGPSHERTEGPSPVEQPRRHARHRVPVRVKLRSLPTLVRFVARDISAGGMFFRPRTRHEIDDEVDVILHHPISEATFELIGRVARVEDDGVALEFNHLTSAQRADLKTFIVTGKRPA